MVCLRTRLPTWSEPIIANKGKVSRGQEYTNNSPALLRAQGDPQRGRLARCRWGESNGGVSPSLIKAKLVVSIDAVLIGTLMKGRNWRA